MRIRNCDACGGEAEIYLTRNGKYGTSCFISCSACGMRTRLFQLGTKGESGMVNEAVKQWETRQSDITILELLSRLKENHQLINELKSTDAEAMARSYRRYVNEEGGQ